MVEMRSRAAYGQPGSTDLTLRLTPGEMAAAGGDAQLLVMWLGDVINALVAARSGDWVQGQDPEAIRVDTAQTVTSLYHRLRPRLDGVLAAAIRAHKAARGSVGQLATAMDTGRSTAQDRRDRLPDPPSTWEQWATGTQHTSTTDKEDTVGSVFRGGNVSINSTVRDQISYGGSGGPNVQANGGRLVINGKPRECLECGPATRWGDFSTDETGAVVVKCLKCRTTWTLR